MRSYDSSSVIVFIIFQIFLYAVSSSEVPTPRGDPESAIKGLVSRVLGVSYANQFQYEVIPQDNGHDVFEVSAADPSGIVLKGNNGVSFGMALNYYLKYMCNSSVSWGRDRTGDNIQLPSSLPVPSKTTRIVSPHKYRYYQNVCTVSYSMAWWDFERWQREIDWMALNGLNFILSFTGQEYVWQKFYRSINLTDLEIQDYFVGPAFLAWQRMGNIRGWAGPLDDGWIKKQYVLQKQIVERIRLFGMINIFPGFSGHVPKEIQRVFPNAQVVRSAEWNYFGSQYSEDYLIEPTDPLFATLGKSFYKMFIETYGSDHYFNADTYNEMLPSSSDLNFLKSTNEAIYNAMAAVDPQAVFVMQGWLFRNTGAFWNSDRVKAFLSGVPDKQMIILDLSSETDPIWSKTESFFGKPFIWCMLHNYGGARGIYGNLTTIANDIIDALLTPGNTMEGVGMTPEAIEHNPVVYDLMGEMSWRKDKVVDVMTWLDSYVTRRYGNWSSDVHTAWQLLYQGAYQFHFSWNIHSMTLRAPGLKLVPYTDLDSGKISQAWQLLMKAVNNNDLDRNIGPLRYDLVDIGRQVLVDIFADLYLMHEAIYTHWVLEKKGDVSPDLDILSEVMLKIIEDLDNFLGSDTNFLLGHWTNEAILTAAGNSSTLVMNQIEFSARNQITVWGPNENINDYAGKDWAGLMKDYYYKRWELYLTIVSQAVKSGKEVDFDAYKAKRQDFEWEWNNDFFTTYTTTPVGDAIAIGTSILKKYTRDEDYVSANYQVSENSDIARNNLYGEIKLSLWGNSSSQLVYLCEINPKCIGFSVPDLVFKEAVENIVITQVNGTTLYLKKK